jgi:hypothetical protein
VALFCAFSTAWWDLNIDSAGESDGVWDQASGSSRFRRRMFARATTSNWIRFQLDKTIRVHMKNTPSHSQFP